MSDNLTPEQRRVTMQAVKSKDSKMEVRFRSALWKSGLRFFKNVNNLVGKPDIVFPRKKVVIFLDSCFWHGCPKHLKLPVTRKEYWEGKITRNHNRDQKVNENYLELGWKVIRFWEHELKEGFQDCVDRVSKEIRA
jgi:DNA mismatch endonuclease (patch repair protein)